MWGLMLAGGADLLPPDTGAALEGCVVERREIVGGTGQVCTETWWRDEDHPIERVCTDERGGGFTERASYDAGGCRDVYVFAGDELTTELTRCDARHQPVLTQTRTGAGSRADTLEAYANTYDAEGRLVRQVRSVYAGGRYLMESSGERAWTWDADGRLVAESWSGYHAAGHATQTWKGDRLVARVSVSEWPVEVAERETYAYDREGRLIETVVDERADGAPDTLLTYAYAGDWPFPVRVSATRAGEAEPYWEEVRHYVCG